MKNIEKILNKMLIKFFIIILKLENIALLDLSGINWIPGTPLEASYYDYVIANYTPITSEDYVEYISHTKDLEHHFLS